MKACSREATAEHDTGEGPKKDQRERNEDSSEGGPGDTRCSRSKDVVGHAAGRPGEARPERLPQHGAKGEPLSQVVVDGG